MLLSEMGIQAQRGKALFGGKFKDVSIQPMPEPRFEPWNYLASEPGSLQNI